MIDTNYKFSLDSIESNSNLSFDKFKKVSFNKSNYYDELIPYFYKDLPSESAFDIKYDNDVNTMSNDFSDQYDELYQCGARNIVNNKNYKEEYEYFSPLYITKTGLPEKFIIFRVDGPGLGNISGINFKSEIINKFKTVRLFDMTKESVLGEWLHTNFIENAYFPDSPLEIDFRNLEFSRWNGIDYQNGGYTSKSMFIDDILDEEKEIFELEKFVFDSYKNNKVVFPNILNLSFLFDDSPSTPEEKRKWSINRYYGFYLDELELVTTISPYLTIPLKDDVTITSTNILTSSDGYPFKEEWTNKKPFYVEYNGNYYLVEQFTETISNQLIKIKNVDSSSDRMSRDLGFASKKVSNVKVVSTKELTTNTKSSVEDYSDVIITKYRIISDIDLTGKESELNKNFGEIDSSNRLIDFNSDNLIIPNFSDADVWLIEVDGIMHNLVKEDTSIRVNSDYSFTFRENSFTYRVAGIDKIVSTIVDFVNTPKKFSIYKAKFTDIKDFDDRIVNTEYSKYEYEKSNELTNTDETKMYFENLNSTASPRDLDDFVYKNEVVNIPVSSEYTANYETFKIEGGNLSEIWRKNPVYCRFGYQNSISSNDVPYLLNNSLIFEDYNRTVNPFDSSPKRIERNLDYFYSINSSSTSYIHHSLHIEKREEFEEFEEFDTSFKFELDKYLNINGYTFDYFTYFFSKDIRFFNNKIKKNTRKYSYLNIGDESIPNHTLFRGIKFSIYNVDGVNLDSNNRISKINTSSSNEFDDYKFSILMSSNEYRVVDSGPTQSINESEWVVIDNWNMDMSYPKGSIVIHDDILYISSDVVGPSSPVVTKIVDGESITIPSSPANLPGWSYYTSSSANTTIFWVPINNGGEYNLGYVYNSGEYYSKRPFKTNFINTSIPFGFSEEIIEIDEEVVPPNIDFWNPNLIKYLTGNLVLFNRKEYISLIDNNIYSPNHSSWLNTSLVSNWEVKTYSKGDVVISNDKYYMSLVDNNNDILTNSLSWKFMSLVGIHLWIPIPVWNPSTQYNTNNKVIHNNIVYRLSSSLEIGEEPGINEIWIREYSLVPNNTINYSSSNNSIIEMNNRYYLALKESTLNNGIVIYINKKWKNILVNINISDNTYTNISESDRDDLYSELYSKLTASNFISCVNDITNKYGFSDYLSYVIIGEDDTISRYSYDGNISNLPYIILCDGPDGFDVKIQSLLKRPISLPNTLNPSRRLDSGRLIDIVQLNYYNNTPIAANIIENEFVPKVFENYHGNKNVVKDTIYRFSGYYMPLFYDIELFGRGSEFNKSGNYLFDTELSEFGMMKERKVRKINRRGSVLKLRNESDEKSIYPMLDEFGYSLYDFFIFSSTWDLRYYLETDVLPMNGSRSFLQRYNTDEGIVSNIEDIQIPIQIPNNIGPQN